MLKKIALILTLIPTLVLASTIDDAMRFAPAPVQKPVLAFVSFSMPDASLKALAEQTYRKGAILVLRGFRNQSIQETLKHAVDVFSNAKRKLRLQINPVLFQKYGIDSVPCFVNQENGQKVCGNVPFSDALSMLSKKHGIDNASEHAKNAVLATDPNPFQTSETAEAPTYLEVENG